MALSTKAWTSASYLAWAKRPDGPVWATPSSTLNSN